MTIVLLAETAEYCATEGCQWNWYRHVMRRQTTHTEESADDGYIYQEKL